MKALRFLDKKISLVQEMNGIVRSVKLMCKEKKKWIYTKFRKF